MHDMKKKQKCNPGIIKYSGSLLIKLCSFNKIAQQSLNHSVLCGKMYKSQLDDAPMVRQILIPNLLSIYKKWTFFFSCSRLRQHKVSAHTEVFNFSGVPL